MKGKIERWFPLVIGSLAAVVYLGVFYNRSLPSSVKELFSSGMALSAITVGFLATAQSILFSIDKKYVIQQLKATKTYNTLINYFMSAINWSFLLAIFSAVSLIINFEKQESWHSLFFAAWLFMFVTVISSCYRIIDTFASILRSPD